MLYVFFCFFWHMNLLHWRNTLVMELKHLTAFEFFRGLQLLPMEPAGVYAIVWYFTPARNISLWSIIPNGFLHSFASICCPDRVLHTCTTRPGLFPDHLLSQPGVQLSLKVSSLVCRNRALCDEIEDGLSFVCDQCYKNFKTLGWYMKHMHAS